MGKFIDLTGMKYGRLSVKQRVENDKNGCVRWRCECDCGGVTVVRANALRKGHIVSCGCYCREQHTTHGGFGTRLYPIWRSMMDRCFRETHRSYKDYGGRGIKVCAEWREFEKFRGWAITNGYDETSPRWQCTLDRIDVNGDYTPSNCRWVDMKVQGRNKRNNRLLDYNGEQHTLSEWAEILGVGYQTLYARITRYGWNGNDVLGQPVETKYSNKRL